MADYANDVLVEPEWLERHLDDDSIRIVEVDENPALYDEAHIPGAIGFDWREDLQDQVRRDFLGPEDFGELFGGRDHLADLHGARLRAFCERVVDTTVRGLVYEAAGSVPADLLVRGAESAREAARTWEIPLRTMDADPARYRHWLGAAKGAVDGLLDAPR